MFENMDVIRMARAMGSHAMARQGMVARNVANADTPGYRAQDMGSFANAWKGGFEEAMRATDPRHFTGGAQQVSARPDPSSGELSPNGNSVSLEKEMMRAADIRREHNLSLTIYRSSLSLLRASLGKR